MTEFYRFRSIEQLLGDKYQELERQTIYFASPEELNDPMEGFRDIVWSGDKIVWTNLFKHYVHCLFLTYIHFQVIGETTDLKVVGIPIWGRWDEPLSPQAKILFDSIWEKVFNKFGLGGLSEKIANIKRRIRRDELLVYLWFTHAPIISEINKEFIKLGLVPESKPPLLGKLPELLTNIKYFELMEQIGDEKKIEALYSGLYQITNKQKLALMYRLRTDSNEIFEKNKRLLLFTFPEVYVKRLESFLWHQWYTACFMKNYHNSSAWGNYGDSHKGVCLIFEAVESNKSKGLALNKITGWGSDSKGRNEEHWNFTPMTFYEVRYAEKAVEIDFFRSMGTLPEPALMNLWYSDQDGNLSECGNHIGKDGDIDSWRKNYWDNFYPSIITKTKDWSYEQEHRLILKSLHGNLEKSQRILNYDFNSLKGIIFGIRTSEEDKLKIIEIIERKCMEEKRTEFNFFQAYYSPQSADIRKFEIL